MNFRKICLLIVFIVQQSLSAISTDDEAKLYADYGVLLEKYAKPTGVDYASWFANQEDIQAVSSILSSWAKVDLAALSTEQQKAFYINLYNLAMIQAVFDYYPINSVAEILPDFGIFKMKFIRQGTRTLSLDDVEKVILLKEYPDARIHFAVNCASRSCPPLRAEPFMSSTLDAQMDEQTGIYLNDEWGVQVKGNTVHISALFDWYRSDFPEGNLIGYINTYRSGAELPINANIQFLHYDWALNTPLVN